jgi:hypothetical protein
LRGVAITPGATELTRMFFSASSSASACDSIPSAAFAAA